MNYESLLEKIKKYKRKYKVSVIGKTCFKRKIYAVEITHKLGNPTAFFVASVHGRENITTDLICKMIDEKLFDDIFELNFAFVLMANPDGVELSHSGIKSVSDKNLSRLVQMNSGSYDFLMWKANGRGVDINNNFNARWGTNVGSLDPSPQGFAGDRFESEPETKAIVSYTKKIQPFFTVSYHSKGEEIYYNFFQLGKDLERDTLIAGRFAESTGYVIKNPENSSSGGFKDYCVSVLKIPALTIEVGNDFLRHPIKTESLDEIFMRNKNVAKDTLYAYNIFRKYR